jgi:hypothetical protein
MNDDLLVKCLIEELRGQAWEKIKSLKKYLLFLLGLVVGYGLSELLWWVG